jgi:ABC-2 type transport system ATP-binding protein
MAVTSPLSAASGARDGVALRCRGLVKRYPDVTAVNGLDLEVRRGECFGLLGPNGAGKTTTIEILEGLLAADAGEVEVLGLRWDRDERELRERLGIQLQETLLSEKLSVEETLRLFRSFYRRGPGVDEVLRLVELDAKRRAWFGKLSGGQKQRLAVACALVGQPDLLFLDEPTTGLDPQSRRQLWTLLERYRAGGGTILLTTHYMDEAELLCDRVAIVDRGQVIALGTPRELIDSLGADHVIEFALPAGDPPLDAAALRALPAVGEVRATGDTWSLITARVPQTLPALLDTLGPRADRLVSLTTHTATLEDVFVALTGRHLRDV